jgi:hypothetical protein
VLVVVKLEVECDSAIGGHIGSLSL